MRSTTRILALPCLALLGYTTVRAATTSFVHDESLSYSWFTNRPLQDLWNLQPASANHHFLNSVAMRVARFTLGTSELALRFHSLLAHLVYLVASLFLVGRFRSRLLAVTVFALLNLNPFVLDFFSLARGYGLMVAFSLAALTVATRPVGVADDRLSGDLLAVALSGLGVLANLSAVLFAIALVMVLCAVNLWAPFQSGGSQQRTLKRAVVSSLALAAAGGLIVGWALPRGLALKEAGELYAGGERGFWVDTVGSLVDATRYDVAQPKWMLRLFRRLIATAVIAQWGLIGLRVWRREFGRIVPLFIPTAILLTIAACSMLQHHYLDSRFLHGRTAIFLIPVFFVSLGHFADDLWSTSGRYLQHAVQVVTIVAVVIQALLSFNLRSFHVWRYDADTREAVFALAELQHLPAGQPLKLAATWLFEPTVNYYIATHELGWLPVDRVGMVGAFDYYLVQGGLVPDEDAQLSGLCTRVMREFASGTRLLRNCATPE
ncbi:MAG: hypothetical protein QM778_11055 [Myxococcales bacterium]